MMMSWRETCQTADCDNQPIAFFIHALGNNTHHSNNSERLFHTPPIQTKFLCFVRIFKQSYDGLITCFVVQGQIRRD